MSTKHEGASQDTQDNSGVDFLQTKWNRRRVITGASLGAAGMFLVSCGNEPQVQQVPGSSNGSFEAVPTIPTVEELSIDIDSLPYSELLYADREDRNPELTRDLFDRGQRDENGKRIEFINFYQTSKADVMTNGAFDLNKATTSFSNKLEAALVTFCDPESLRDFINVKDNGEFAETMAAHDVDIIRGLCGYELHRYTDEEVRGYPIYKEFTAAHRATLTRYIQNAQREGGNLNETIRIVGMSCAQREEKENLITFDLSLDLTNQVSGAYPQPAEKTASGTLDMTVWHKSKESELIIFGRPNEYGVNFPDNPLKELAEAA